MSLNKHQNYQKKNIKNIEITKKKAKIPNETQIKAKITKMKQHENLKTKQNRTKITQKTKISTNK